MNENKMQCPECGEETSYLYTSTWGILMCDACHDISDEGMAEREDEQE
tara:strand:- start:14157 stop:14300 length:144 start_codon:yes stop_codon:yes gene_type:complete